MQVAVIGAGYVGLVTGAGLAALGHRVRIGEIDEARVRMLNQGDIPLHEADLHRVVAEGISRQLLTFHNDNSEAIDDADVVLLALPTPPSADGSADLSFIMKVLTEIADELEPGVVIATKSTVPVGSVAKFQDLLDGLGAKATVVSNPEFLREGTAVSDFFHPDRIVIGSRDQRATETLIDLYKELQAPIVVTDPASSEMIKYASNAYLATRITFANALANLCESVDADVSSVLEGMGYDRRIGFHFLNPGPGYGGSCFPKDTKALVAIADLAGYDFSLLKGVIEVNELQMRRTAAKVLDEIGGIEAPRVALWGLAFKAGTDDVRESPAIAMARILVAAGVEVTAFDPAVKSSPIDGIVLAPSAADAAKGADALLIATEWPEFKAVDLRSVRESMRGTSVIDARNLLDPLSVRQLGMSYRGIGR